MRVKEFCLGKSLAPFRALLENWSALCYWKFTWHKLRKCNINKEHEAHGNEILEVDWKLLSPTLNPLNLHVATNRSHISAVCGTVCM